MQNSSDLKWLIDRTQIIETIATFANAIDRKDWQKLRDLLTDELEIDYSDFRSEAPRRIRADEYVQQRSSSLSHLKTLHISTNHEITIQADRAECRSAYLIYRLDPNREAGSDRLDTAGNYLHQLIQVGDRWRIWSITQTVVVISGDRQVHGAFRSQ